MKFVNLSVFLCLVFAACGSDNPVSSVPDDGWQTATLTASGFDTTSINSMLSQIESGLYVNIHSILLVKGDKLVFEKYFEDYTARDTHPLYSAGKSIISIFTGLALDQGLIDSVGRHVIDYFPEYRPFDNDSEFKRNMQLRHLLTMTSGFDCGSINDPNSNCRIMFSVLDPIHFMLDLPVVNAPGTYFNYNDGAPQVMKRIIEKRAGKSIDQLAYERLYPALEIPVRNYALTLAPRDMAKLGALYLNDGVWKGQRLISSEWIAESTANQVANAGNRTSEYGYFWWRNNFSVFGRLLESYYAAGNGGQYIFMIPDLQLVAVFTGGNYDSNLTRQPFNMLQQYILPAALTGSK